MITQYRAVAISCHLSRQRGSQCCCLSAHVISLQLSRRKGSILSDDILGGEFEGMNRQDAEKTGDYCGVVNVQRSRWFNLPQRMSQRSVAASESRIQTVQG